MINGDKGVVMGYSLSHASRRAKGAAAEREAAALLTELLGFVVQRSLGQTRDGGVDLQVADLAAVEVKRQENARLHEWLRQVEDAVHGTTLLPAVMWRPSRRGWVVCMPAEDWCSLVREALKGVPRETEGDRDVGNA